MSHPLTLLYFPYAVALGALHALEPGHAKTLTAAYLIGTKGTKRDAILLGLSVAATHSLVVIGLAVTALVLGKETLTHDALYWLQLASGGLVIALGVWMLVSRLSVLAARRRRLELQAHAHEHGLDHGHEHGHDHEHLDDDAHARAHAAAFPDYVKEGQRPTLLQVVAFGAAGGIMPCPASITVMLLALSVGQTALGLFTVLGFSIGLAVTLVGIGLMVVAGLSQVSVTGRFGRFAQHAPIISAVMVIASGVFALLFAH
jgi:nickel/cobalt exporter